MHNPSILSKTRQMKIIGTLVLLLCTYVGLSQQTTTNWESLSNDIENLRNQYKAVGLSIAVIQNNQLVYSEGFGYRDLENQLAVDTKTVFPIGSITKSFTGSLLGILESKEQVSLRDKPSSYIPNFRFYNDEMNNLITIEDLLSHKSGIGNQDTSLVFFPESDNLKTVERLRYLKPEAEIKNSFEYSNMGYVLAATIVEQSTNKKWAHSIQENLFNPLQMNHSFTSLEEMKKSNNFSLGYGMSQGQVQGVNFEEFYSIAPAGAIKSNVIDLSNWMLTWLNKGVFNGTQVIPEDYVKKATSLQNHKNDDYEKEAYLFGDGFGWRLRSSYGHFRVDHGGNTYGFTSLVVMFPFEKMGIVVLTNQDNSLLPYIISDYISKNLLNLDPKFEYPVVVKELYKPKENEATNGNVVPAHPLKHYCGTYRADGFGEIQIIEEDQKLFAVLPTFKFRLEHLQADSFFLKGTNQFTDAFNPEFTVQFRTSITGEIGLLDMHSQKEPVSFIKQK